MYICLRVATCVSCLSTNYVYVCRAPAQGRNGPVVWLVARNALNGIS